MYYYIELQQSFFENNNKVMDFTTAFTIFLLIILYFSSSFLEATTVGFAAPLIHLTSPKHPLYNPHATRKDIIRQKQRISIERQRYLAHKRRNFDKFQGEVPPVESDVVIKYSIGSPPVEQLAIFDTGSDIIWLQCQRCIKCFNQTNPIFDPKKSSTYKLVKCLTADCNYKFGSSCKSEFCKFDARYVDGSSTHGDVATDTLTLPEYEYSPKFTLPKAIFGCGHENNNNYTFGASGIVGLQNSSISLIGQTGVDSFCYCKSEDGGYIRFGSISRLMGSKTTMFTDKYGHYQVILIGIIVENEKLDIPSNIFEMITNDPDSGVIVDSGSTYTFLNPLAWEAVIRKIGDLMSRYQSYVTRDWRLCYNGDENPGVTLEKMPSVHLLFDNYVKIALPNENVWTDKDEDGSICLKMFPNQDDLTVLGAELFADYNVGYDLKENLLWLDYQRACEF